MTKKTLFSQRRRGISPFVFFFFTILQIQYFTCALVYVFAYGEKYKSQRQQSPYTVQWVNIDRKHFKLKKKRSKTKLKEKHLSIQTRQKTRREKIT